MLPFSATKANSVNQGKHQTTQARTRADDLEILGDAFGLVGGHVLLVHNEHRHVDVATGGDSHGGRHVRREGALGARLHRGLADCALAGLAAQHLLRQQYAALLAASNVPRSERRLVKVRIRLPAVMPSFWISGSSTADTDSRDSTSPSAAVLASGTDSAVPSTRSGVARGIGGTTCQTAALA